MGYLAGWNTDRRIEFTIDHTMIDMNLYNFTVFIPITETSETPDGCFCREVFDYFDPTVSGVQVDRKKIAVTDESDNQLMVEVELCTDEFFSLWVKVNFISANRDTKLYFYYDKDHADNVEFVGDTGSTLVEGLWDGYFDGVWHLTQEIVDPQAGYGGAGVDWLKGNGPPAESLGDPDDWYMDNYTGDVWRKNNVIYGDVTNQNPSTLTADLAYNMGGPWGPTNSIDGNLLTMYRRYDRGGIANWKIDFRAGTEVMCDKIRIYGTSAADWNKIYGSNNNSDWDVLTTITAPSSAWYSSSFTNTTAYRYYRLEIKVSDSDTRGELVEIEFWADGLIVWQKISSGDGPPGACVWDSTSNRLHGTPGTYVEHDKTYSKNDIVVTVSDETILVESGDVQKLVDGSSSNGVVFTSGAGSVGEYLDFDFGALVNIAGGTLMQSGVASHGTWQWSGSVSGTIYTNIGNGYTLSATNPQDQVELNGNTEYYKHYRLEHTGGSANNGVTIYEIDFEGATNLHPTTQKESTYSIVAPASCMWFTWYDQENYIEIPYYINSPQQFTIQVGMVLRSTSYGSGPNVGNVYSTSSNQAYGVGFSGDYYAGYVSENINFKLIESWNTPPETIATDAIPVREYVVCTATFDGSTLKLYRNGTLVDSKSLTGWVSTSENFWFGVSRSTKGTWVPGYRTQGGMRAIQISNIVRNEYWIKAAALSSAGKLITKTGTNLSYRFATPIIRRNIWTTDDYVFKATTSGAEIYEYDINTANYIGTCYPYVVNSVWADNDYLYMATTTSGVLRSPITSISGLVFDNISMYKNYPDIQDNYVTYIHGNTNNLCISTVSGVDNINFTTNSGVRLTTPLPWGADKCYQTDEGRFYYVKHEDRLIIDEEYPYERVFTITSGTVINAQEIIETSLTPSNFIYSHCFADGSDLKFYDIREEEIPSTIMWQEDEITSCFVQGLVAGDTEFLLKYGATSTVQTDEVIAQLPYEMWYIGYGGSPARYRVARAISQEGITWQKQGIDLEIGSSGQFDDYYTTYPCVIQDGDTPKMWYSAYDGVSGGYRIGYTYCKWIRNGLVLDISESTYGEVLYIGADGDPDDINILRASVIKDDDDSYKMWYMAYDGSNWTVCYAVSYEGTAWTKYGRVLDVGVTDEFDDSHASAPTVIKDGSTYKMWYGAHDGTNWNGIGYATSSDGVNWTKQGKVMGVGSPGSWDDYGVYAPCVIKDGSTYKMWYAGDTSSVYWRIGYATSTNGTTWVKQGMVIDFGGVGEFDEVYTTMPTVIKDGSTYKMWYAGSDGVWSLGYAISTNGSSWTKQGQVFEKHPTSGKFDDAHVYGPSVIKDGLIYKMWYIGHDGAAWVGVGYAESSPYYVNVADTPDNASASSYYSAGTAPKYALDGVATTYWHSLPTGIIHWWMYDFGSGNEKIIIQLKLQNHHTVGDRFNEFNFKGSNNTTDGDDGDWTLLYEGDHSPVGVGGWGTYIIPNTNSYRYYKVTSTGYIPSNNTARLAEVVLIDGTESVGDVWGRGIPFDNNNVYHPTVIKDDDDSYKMWYIAYNGVSDGYRIAYATSTDENSWIKWGVVIDPGSSGDFDDRYFQGPCVFKDGSTYKMWYAGYDGDGSPSRYQLGYATSTDGSNWTKYGAVLDVGAGGEFDDVHVGSPYVMKDGSTYKMWYCGHDGSYWVGLGYATSPDGINWTKQGQVLGLGSGGEFDAVHVYRCSVFKESSNSYLMWYAAYDGSNWLIGYATSTDGISWNKQGLELDLGVTGDWDDNGVYSPTVMKDGSTYKMWYAGHDGTTWRILYANTWQSGEAYQWSGRTMVLELGTGGEFDDAYVYMPWVIKDGSTYKMWYSGYDSTAYRIGYATSPDGLIWTKQGMVLDLGSGFESVHVHSPRVIKEGLIYKLWYTGSDGSNNRIGYATSSDGIVWTKQGMVLDLGITAEFDVSGAGHSCVIKDGSTYKMWYGGYSSPNWTIGYATSPDGIVWTKQGQVLPIGEAGEVDVSHAYGPCVIKTQHYKVASAGQEAYSVYRVNDTSGLQVVYDSTKNWATSSGHIYEPGSIIPAGTVINDIYVAENKSQYNSNDNVILLATDDGAVIIEERKGDEANSRFKYYKIM